MAVENGVMNRRIHWILAALSFLFSFLVYFRTVAPTTSFWDCGEFIACSYTLGVIHPPGAPLYLLIGRLMTMLPFFKDIGLRVNMFSVFISALTVLFTYLVIVQLIRKWRAEPQKWEDRLILYGSAFLGAMAFAFTDSFWFNSVEAEVYAFSMFFTAFVVWLALHWAEHSEKSRNVIYILLIFYVFGLSVGVHLLNILTFPFILLIALYESNQTMKRLLLLLTVQVAVPILLYSMFYQYNPEAMSYQDMVAHQAKAGSFLKWFGAIWIVLTLGYIRVKDRNAFRIWWVIPVLVLIGYSVYVMIYLRAGLHPAINENDPSTVQAMKDYLARKQYGEEELLLTFLHRKADFWGYQIHEMYTRYFGWQFIGQGKMLDGIDRIIEIISFRGLYGIPFLIGLWGAVCHFSRDWKRALAVLVLFLATGYAILIYLNQPDPQPRERDYSYVGSFFAFALWIGIGAAGIFEWITAALGSKGRLKTAVLGVATVVLLLALPIHLFAFNFHSHDRSGEYTAYDYSYNILESCEKDGILFTNGDNDTFPLWFLQEVYGVRKDVRVVNLSLLNTPWYIKQLRDIEPRVLLRITYRDSKGNLRINDMTDDAINSLSYIPWKKKEFGIDISKEAKSRALEEAGVKPGSPESKDIPDTLKFMLEPTYPEDNPQVLRVQDLMIIRILQANQWTKPVYFAVTVSYENQLGLQPYFRMDGLAYQVMPFPVRTIKPGILRTNLMEKFLYRGLNDPKVYLNIDTIKLLGNVRQAFLQLAQSYLREGRKSEALAVLDTMSRRLPVEHVPFSNERSALLVADYFKRAGRPDEYKNLLRYLIPNRLVTREDRLGLASYYAHGLNDWEQSEILFRELINQDPNDVQAVSSLYQVLRESRQYDKAVRLLEDWLLRHPKDPVAEKELESMKMLAAQDSSRGSAASRP